MTDRPPLPPFTRETAAQKVQAAEDAWNSRDPGRVALAYSEDSAWRNRGQFVTGRAADRRVPDRQVGARLDYALRKNLWAFDGNRIAVRFQYECHDRDGQWWRSYGNELWEFDEHGLMTRREASINDVAITEADRRIFGPAEAERGLDFPSSSPRYQGSLALVQWDSPSRSSIWVTCRGGVANVEWGVTRMTTRSSSRAICSTCAWRSAGPARRPSARPPGPAGRPRAAGRGPPPPCRRPARRSRASSRPGRTGSPEGSLDGRVLARPAMVETSRSSPSIT